MGSPAPKDDGPPRPWLFLSHGGEDSETLAFVEAVSAQLDERGFEVFEYRADVKYPERWRFTLLAALLTCDCGVVLLDERAPMRRWVRYERGVFKVRQFLQRGFNAYEYKVSVTQDAAHAIDDIYHALKPLGIGHHDTNWPEFLAAAIGRHPEPLDEIQCKTCIEAIILESKIAQFLKSLPLQICDLLFKELAECPGSSYSEINWHVLESLQTLTDSRLDANSSDVQRETVIRHKLARAIVRAGLACGEVLAENCNRHLTENQFSEIIESLGTLMIPLQAVAPLAELFRRESLEAGPYLVTAESEQVLLMAIRRAWGVERGPMRQPIVTVNESEVSPSETILSAVDQALMSAFRIPAQEDLREIAATKLPQLNTPDQNAELSLVVLQHIPSSETIRHLRDGYPELVFIVRETLGGGVPDAQHIVLDEFGSRELHRTVQMLLNRFQYHQEEIGYRRP